MACRLAENEPLKKLRTDIGIQASCHSFRPDCVHRLRQASRTSALGASGAVIGYCQALFRRIGTPAENTRRVIDLLAGIRAPWSNSHELFWGHKGTDSASAFINSAFEPLRGVGRVPILITPLRPASNAAELKDIFSVSAPVEENEPVLVRTVIGDRADVTALSDLLHLILDQAFASQRLPNWWPLIQGSVGLEDWQALKDSVGTRWKYLNIAVNPFMNAECRQFVTPQVTVCQIPVGTAETTGKDGFVGLPEVIPISGRATEKGYDLVAYLRSFRDFDVSPTFLLLGPCQEHWTDRFNQQRVAAVLPFIRSACEELWDDIKPEAREMVWRMSA